MKRASVRGSRALVCGVAASIAALGLVGVAPPGSATVTVDGDGAIQANGANRATGAAALVLPSTVTSTYAITTIGLSNVASPLPASTSAHTGPRSIVAASGAMGHVHARPAAPTINRLLKREQR